MEPRSEQEVIKKLGELIKDIRTTMLITLDESGEPRSRPMYTQDAEFDGTIWFFTGEDSNKVRDIRRSAKVNLSYASPSDERYVSVTGMAQVLNDRAKIKEFWSPFLKAWFEGPDDPNIRLLKIEAERAEYWDTPGGKIASVLSIVKTLVTGKHDDEGNNQKLDLDAGSTR